MTKNDDKWKIQLEKNKKRNYHSECVDELKSNKPNKQKTKSIMMNWIVLNGTLNTRSFCLVVGGFESF